MKNKKLVKDLEVSSSSETISKVIKLAKQQLPKEQGALAAIFIKEFYEYSIWGDFALRSNADLCGGVLSCFELFKKRKLKECKIKVFNPEKRKNGWECPNTVIALVHEDMPFLVDSLQMALNSLGVSIYTIVHLGGIKVDRDAAGNVSNIIPIKDKRAAKLFEAPIYIEIKKQTDANALRKVTEALESALVDVRATVNDWQAIKQKLNQVTLELEEQKTKKTAEEQEFLHWISSVNFTFLGYRYYKFAKINGKRALEFLEGSSLGVLKNRSGSKIHYYHKDLSAKAIEVLSSANPLILSKTNTVSTVHLARYTDSVAVKSYDKAGNIIGIHCFVGLYASTAYYSSVRTIPFLRDKANEVIAKFGFPANDYNAKKLMRILEALPREDFIQAEVGELYEMVVGIFQLHERRLTKLFVRKDLYDRYVSCLVYLPRDNFNTDVRVRIQEILLRSFCGIETSFDIFFSESILARIHFVIRLDAKKSHADFSHLDMPAIEREIIETSASWYDMLRETLAANYQSKAAEQLTAKYLKAFPAGYRETFAKDLVLNDIQKIELLSAEHSLEMLFYAKPNQSAFGANTNDESIINFKLFCFNYEINLSDALPILENLGLYVIREQSYKITSPAGSVWINDFQMAVKHKNTLVKIEDVYGEFQEVFTRVWNGEVENDSFNSLVLAAGFNWREISIFRAYAEYLHQIRFPFVHQSLAAALIANPKVAEVLLEIFKLRFDPKQQKGNAKKLLAVKDAMAQKLDAITSFDEDRILTRFLNVIESTVRTNYYQNKDCFSFKFACRNIQDLPLPKPLFEIFVYSARFEGTHLRMAKVARGGLRWSDRSGDFRTEILGLMKAQQVKNVVIVPYGAKGGFVLKKVKTNFSRAELQQEGVACYKAFVGSLLDITDNICGREIVRPKDVVCHDETDPYLVVAADKGTATFSNIANAISKEHGFWLGDAFASGGATGYDHKAIAITARGAWESVKHHFYELGVNVQTTDFTLVGIGDMAGDVFGNGMLLSEHIKLVGAFNHMHIFLDPNPDVAASFKERARLFNLPQSSWDDYQRKLISKGGGIYLRSAKSISLTKEAKALLLINKDSAAPNEVIRALLTAKVDLLWNGGIGTYVKASSESNESVGDRSNDALRVDGKELRCKVISEGGNLGLTQLARIEFAENGGAINTDFIDNSGGVDCSDHEVNLKILLNELVQKKTLSEKARNTLLASMTEEVSKLVLRNNYRQTRAIGLVCAQSVENIDEFAKYINTQEQAGKIGRKLEYLPDNKTILERKRAGQGLTRPEVAILLAYSKLILKEKILASKLMEDEVVDRYLRKEFPNILLLKFGKYLKQHRLRREIISTQLSNDFITTLGITFLQEVQAETGATFEEIVCAYIVVQEILDGEAVFAKIEQTDFVVSAKEQTDLILSTNDLLRESIYQFLSCLASAKKRTK